MPRNASTIEIRAAYVSRARRVHPDIVGPRGLDLMRALNDAWETLKDARRRADFDAEHNRGGMGVVGPAGAGTDDGYRPFWTGAMGKPPGRPWGPVLDFGIFAGWSLGEISRHDRGYLVWLRDRAEGKPLHVEIDRLIDPDAAPETPRGGRR